MLMLSMRSAVLARSKSASFTPISAMVASSLFFVFSAIFCTFTSPIEAALALFSSVNLGAFTMSFSRLAALFLPTGAEATLSVKFFRLAAIFCPFILASSSLAFASFSFISPTLFSVKFIPLTPRALSAAEAFISPFSFISALSATPLKFNLFKFACASPLKLVFLNFISLISAAKLLFSLTSALILMAGRSSSSRLKFCPSSCASNDFKFKAAFFKPALITPPSSLSS